MLSAETAIINRLKTWLPVTVPPTNVASSASVAGMGERDLATLLPLVLVHPGTGADEDQHCEDQIGEVQTWSVVLVVKNVPDPKTLAATYQAAGLLMKNIVLALDGFRELGPEFGELKYIRRPEPDVSLGFCEFGLEFTCDYHLQTTAVEPTPDAFITFDAQHDLDGTQTGEPVAEDNVTLPQ